LKFAAKVALTLCVEAAVAPPFLLGAVLLKGAANDRLLAVQNALRQRELSWLFPQVKAKASGSLSLVVPPRRRVG
jgi:hypothetical protein